MAASACPAAMKPTSNGVFQGDNPLEFALPLAILQICLVVLLTRLLAVVLKPLRQPRVIAEIIGGIILGPSALGRNKYYMNAVFPTRSLTVLDTLANIGLVFFLFLVGIELDPKALRRTGKKALSIAVGGVSVPFALGIGTSYALRATVSKGVDGGAFLLFMGVAFSITAFPVLARILAELKLLTTDVGRMAMSAAAINDVAAWILLALAICLSGTGQSPLVSLWVLLSGCGFVFFCILIVPRIFEWMQKRCPDGEPVKEIYVCATLLIVLVGAFATDAIGIHALFGAFIVGVLVPKGPFAGALVEKIEDLVSGLFLPLFFVSSGLKTDIATIRGLQSWGFLALVIATACLGKIVGTVAVSLLCKMHFKEALALGFLMNTKGLVELIVLNIGKDRKVLNDQTFAIMVLMAIFTTFITTPLVMAVYEPNKRTSNGIYKHRTIKRKDPNHQLRILACFYSARNLPTMINLIEASRGTEKKEGLCVYAMHLMELSERSSAILMVHKARNNGIPIWNKGRHSDSDQVVVAFEAFRQLSHVTIRPMTAISPMHDMHEDICGSAERKRAAMIILPFHKHQRFDGVLENTRNDFHSVNKKVLENAQCSVGILVDRGLGGNTHVSASDVSSIVTVLYFGGNDDAEALAYGVRMAEHPGISVNIIRFLASSGISGEIVGADVKDHHSSSADENFLDEMRRKYSSLESFKMEVRVVRNNTETVDAIKEYNRCHMFLVGRMPEGPVAAAMDIKSDCPELGPVGSMLISPDFSTSASVLVVQQYTGGGMSPIAGSSDQDTESS
ncbi:cation/H(+) antiporter 18-like [Pistacia vera]|uniref:cation/H(+) antiporter 18-like n=1 Tax=Pistacia vera TaxID=55513 RepID=UPI001262CD98|nr:cation/H(+) antiporter 18-like [Pistacia vera]